MTELRAHISNLRRRDTLWQIVSGIGIGVCCVAFMALRMIELGAL